MQTRRLHFFLVSAIAIFAGSISGCGTPPKSELSAKALERREDGLSARQAERKANEKKHLENLKNWDSLKVGMTIQEVDALVGPLDHRQVQIFMQDVGRGLGELRFEETLSAADGQRPMEITMVFDGYGKLKSWQRR
jgi:hypothetical protein